MTPNPKIFFFKFFTTLPAPVRMFGQAFVVTGPCIASNYGL